MIASFAASIARRSGAIFSLVVAMMSKQWHILIVLDDEYLNRNIVNSLQIDGYFVKGVTSGTEAVHLLWAEEYDVVVSDQKMPDADGFELLQWIRTYRPGTRMIMIGMPGSSVTRTQALENGVVSYLEKPLDLHLLKEELRRLLQQTGFSANLDSFDLLDVIQIVNMSHKTIAMVVNTGLEEQGLLGFQAGELVWAEYGILRGEEAFFALAAHKNGTITHQPWTAQIRPNVTLPLSRLIFQALQYRSKYAAFKQLTGEQVALAPAAMSQAIQSPDDEDAPFLFVEPVLSDSFQQVASSNSHKTPDPVTLVTNEAIEWWQEPAPQEHSNTISSVRPVTGSPALSVHPSTDSGQLVTKDTNATGTSITPSTVRKTSAGQRTDLPSWLIDQPTQFDMPAIRPSSLTGSDKVPAEPIGKATLSERQSTASAERIAEQSKVERSSNVSSHLQSSPERQLAEKPGVSQLQSLTSSRKTDDFSAPPSRQKSDPLPTNGSNLIMTTDNLHGNASSVIDTARSSSSERIQSTAETHSGRTQKRNFAALSTALQTLGFSIPGFIATAIVNVDGQPIAQVTVDDLDISRLCEYFSNSMQGALWALGEGAFGHYEDTIITSLTHFILFRLVGSSRDIFQVLIVTRDTDPVECLEMMANIEPALEAAL
jgi:DNA-binding response OmpR family regulator/predicted regulator of Ras-like GTPase activity (Roadblock/LC7/MglB family)